jgi:hypothetical protein
MTYSIRILLKAVAALSPSFGGEFAVHNGRRYRATLSLNSLERLSENAMIARKFRALGFSKVRVSGVGAVQVPPCLVRSLRSLDYNGEASVMCAHMAGAFLS